MSEEAAKVKNTSKKPIYKQWWFWVIIVVVIIGIGGSSSKSEDKYNTDNESSTSTNSVSCSDDEKIEMIDLSSMGANDIAMWAKDKGFDYKVGTASYSETVAREGLLSQSIKAGEKVCKGATLTVTYSLGKEPTQEQKNALAKAKSYSETMHMSKAGIYKQLTSEYGEGFTADAAKYAIDNLVADYNANALAKAKSYQSTMHMSKANIYKQLTSEYGEGFTASEAQYAIDNLPD